MPHTYVDHVATLRGGGKPERQRGRSPTRRRPHSDNLIQRSNPSPQPKRRRSVSRRSRRSDTPAWWNPAPPVPPKDPRRRSASRQPQRDSTPSPEPAQAPSGKRDSQSEEEISDFLGMHRVNCDVLDAVERYMPDRAEEYMKATFSSSWRQLHRASKAIEDRERMSSIRGSASSLQSLADDPTAHVGTSGTEPGTYTWPCHETLTCFNQTMLNRPLRDEDTGHHTAFESPNDTNCVLDTLYFGALPSRLRQTLDPGTNEKHTYISKPRSASTPQGQTTPSSTSKIPFPPSKPPSDMETTRGRSQVQDISNLHRQDLQDASSNKPTSHQRDSTVHPSQCRPLAHESTSPNAGTTSRLSRRHSRHSLLTSQLASSSLPSSQRPPPRASASSDPHPVFHPYQFSVGTGSAARVYPVSVTTASHSSHNAHTALLSPTSPPAPALAPDSRESAQQNTTGTTPSPTNTVIHCGFFDTDSLDAPDSDSDVSELDLNAERGGPDHRGHPNHHGGGERRSGDGGSEASEDGSGDESGEDGGSRRGRESDTDTGTAQLWRGFLDPFWFNEVLVRRWRARWCSN